ncbi:MAG: hypothetical protein KGZ97_02590 [Bacteroidetes bacterium]|nr:hypothetical protein [Bacteroidota bacterium]
MRKFEKIGGAIVFLLFLLRVFIGTDFNVVLRLGLLFLSLFYLWFGFFLFNRIGFLDLLNKEARSKLNAFTITVGIIMGIVYSFCILSIIYVIYFYALMQFLIVTAAISIIATTLLIGVYNTLNMPLQKFYNQFYKRSLIIGSVIIALWHTPIDKRLDILFKKHPDFIDAYKEHRENPSEQNLEKLKEARSLFK